MAWGILMLVLGIESSCDETGLALYDSQRGLLAHALHSQVELHAVYGGVVPELASRDHIRRVLPLLQSVLDGAQCVLADIDAIAYTQGPGLAGALLVGTSIAEALAFALDIPAMGIHHLEGHLLAPLLELPMMKGESGQGHLSALQESFPFVALLVSGGHTQIMQVNGIGQYVLLGDTLDDAAGEAFDKTAQLLDLGYPGGPALARLAEQGVPERFQLPRPLLNSGDLNFSFSGLKTAVLSLVKAQSLAGGLDAQSRADIAHAFQEAVTEVLTKKCLAAMRQTGLQHLIVSGGVGANRRLREKLDSVFRKRGLQVSYPRLEFCTDNGAMIAFAGALRLSLQAAVHERHAVVPPYAFSVKPRWPLADLPQP